MRYALTGLAAFAMWLSMVVLTAYGFIIHVVTCLETKSYALLAFGVVIPPIGVVHGWLVSLGVL
jgi:hypothetical protein